MGRQRRWRRRHEFKNQPDDTKENSGEDITSSNPDHGNVTSQKAVFKVKKSRPNKAASWNHWKGRMELLAYFKCYQKEAIRLYNGNEVKPRPDTSILVGDVLLPALTKDVLREPFLILPLNLTNKQRKVAHECCTEVQLYHHAIGSRESNNRQLIVSVYSNFLDFVPCESAAELTDESPKLYKFTPWFCQPNHPWNQTSDEDVMMQEIEAWRRDNLQTIKMLHQYATKCWRTNIDTLQTCKDGEDLSTISPPLAEGTNASIDVKWMLVNTPEKLQQCIGEMNELEITEIAFDIEAYNGSKYTQVTCLIQIALNTGHEYVIDPLVPGVWEQVGQLGKFFADPDIVKIGHSIGGLDIRCLHRDFGIIVVNAFDTYHAARTLKLPQLGLAAICQYYGLSSYDQYRRLKDLYQSCNWQKRPLTVEMLQYGRYDVHYLIKLRQLLIRDMHKVEAAGQATKDEMAEVRKFLHEANNANDDDNANSGDDPSQGSNRSDADDIDQIHEKESSDIEDDGHGDNIPSMPDDGNQSNGNSSSPRNGSASTDSNRSDNADEDDASNVDSANGNDLLPPNLMHVLCQSQRDCLRSTWSGKIESPWQNSLFQSFLRRGRRGDVFWTGHHTDLYKQLVHWRNFEASQRLGHHCLPGLIVSLDFLLAVAYQQPTTIAGLHRICTDLPEVLKHNHEIVEDMLNIVKEFLKDQPALQNRQRKQQKYLNLVYRQSLLKKLGMSTLLDSAKNSPHAKAISWLTALGAGGLAIAIVMARIRSGKR